MSTNGMSTPDASDGSGIEQKGGIGMHPQVKTFHDARSGTATHVVYRAPGGPCAVIDPVFDLDPRSGHTSDAPVEQVTGFLRDQGLAVA